VTATIGNGNGIGIGIGANAGSGVGRCGRGYNRGPEATMRRSLIPGLVMMAAAAWSEAAAPVHHDLTVRLQPESHRLEVVDRLTLDGVPPDEGGGYRFVLHAGLIPEVVGDGWRLERVPGEPDGEFLGLNATTETVAEGVPLEGFRLVPEADPPRWPAMLFYEGPIHHELERAGEEYQRSFSETPGIVDERGAFLAGASFWVPTFGDQLLTFRVRVTGLAPPWNVVSQGRRVEVRKGPAGIRSVLWELEHPTEEVYLVAGPWHEYAETFGDVEALVFLREDDPALAGRYLEATGRYLELYEKMLTDYPYDSFALVENFWETGYGMPGFTLLGPKIIRFPWILTSSYPHELLHNWWGNSVYVDYDSGNWCEGLTAYGADHLFAEQRGEGALHRRTTLQRYTDFVSSGDDFPLVEFTSRRSAASEAVGYGKSLMVHHMMRRAVGDERYLEALRRFARDNAFRRASWSDLVAAFNQQTGADWGPFVEAWTTRSGAPRLEIAEVRRSRTRDTGFPWSLDLTVRQSQPGDPFPLTIPVAVTVEGDDDVVWAEVGTCGRRECRLSIRLPARPLRVDVDPMFDVMRRLDPLEVPPALSTLFGGGDPLFVLPTGAGEEELGQWRALAEAWAAPGEPRTALDAELDALPAGAVWVLGAANRFAGDVAGRLAGQGVTLDDAEVVLPGRSLPRSGHSLVLVARGVADPADAVGWVAADPVEAIAGLARKLPHYTKYSYLGFRGPEPENVAKGMWRPLASPLVAALTEGGEPLPAPGLPERSPLAGLPPLFDAAELLGRAAELADPALEGRGLGSDGLGRATAIVEGWMRSAGLEPAGDDGYRQSWSWTGGEPRREMTLVNLVGRIPGADPAVSHQPVVLMAHLDHLGRGWPDVRAGFEGRVHPGADDNASGVAVAMAVARALAAEPPRARTVLVAVVTGEEAGRLGSRHLLETMGDAVEPSACVNLDTVGRLKDGKLYVLDAGSAREWRFVFMGVGYTTGAPVEISTEPLDSSDQRSCIEAGIPAVQLFTGPTADYHRPSDTADTLDPDGMAVVAEATREAVAYLAERTEPLTVTTGAAAPTAPPRGPGGSRRASLGTVPDFAFAGPGVRVESVVPGSSAEEAGVEAGDVLVGLDGRDITDLRSYSEALKGHQPGDAVVVAVERDGERLELDATLRTR